MSKLEIPIFKSYEEEAAFWDNLDTGPFMDDDDEWFQFEIEPRTEFQITILPDTVNKLQRLAHRQGVSLETIVNVFLVEQINQRENTPYQPAKELIAV